MKFYRKILEKTKYDTVRKEIIREELEHESPEIDTTKGKSLKEMKEFSRNSRKMKK